MPIESMEQYNKAKGFVDSGRAKDPGRLGQSMAVFRGSNPHLFQGSITGTLGEQTDLAQPEGIEGLPELDGPRRAPVAGSHAPKLDMTNSSVADYLGTVADEDPRKSELAEEVRRQTEDSALNNASKLKVFNDPTEWEPKAVANPFSSMPAPPKDTQYFYEPSLEEFQEAVATGALAKQLAKEFPSQKGEIDPEWLEGSKSFAAYKDAAWKHALAQAIKTNTPIVRAAFSDKTKGTVEGYQAKALDPITGFASGALAGATMGLADPAIRSVAPETAEAERRSRMRNPSADLAGQIVGGLSPTGLPSLAAKGATKLLGTMGLGSKGLSGLAKSTAVGAATGAADANVRAIAQSAADALDAGDSAVEAVQRIYDALNPRQVMARSVDAAALGGGMSAGGHLLGSAAGKGARALVSEDGNLKAPLANGMESGVKMSPLGDPVMPPDVQAQVTRARGRRMNADDLIAEESIDPMLSQRLKEQETATSRASLETAKARERLAEATVDTGPVAEEILAMVNEMPAMTPQAASKRTSLQRYARRLRSRGQMTAKELDDVISEVDSQANQDAKRPDPDWNRVSAVLRKRREDFTFDEPTAVENYAIRDKEGSPRVVSDYGAMKTRQGKEQDFQEFENRQMGLPPKLESAPVRLGKASEADAGSFIEKHPDFAQVQKYFNEERAVASDIERSRFTRPKDTNRTAAATQAQYGANKALRDAVNQGYGYEGTVYRGARMSPEQIQSLVSSGKAKADSIWSTSKNMEHALAFAKKGNKGEPVLFEIEGSSSVSLDHVPGLNTFDETVIPTGKGFKVIDSYRGDDGVLRIKLSDGSRSPAGDELQAMADSVEPQVRMTADERQGFKSKILGTSDPKNAIASEKIQRLAARAGIPENIKMLQKLRDSQDWKETLGKSISGIGSSGGTYLKTSQLLRATPMLKSLSGGLGRPSVPEASPAAEELIDRFLAQAVPEARVLNLRGGQAARPTGGILSRGEDNKLRDDMTDEEAALALQIIKNILAAEGQKVRKAQ